MKTFKVFVGNCILSRSGSYEVVAWSMLNQVWKVLLLDSTEEYEAYA